MKKILFILSLLPVFSFISCSSNEDENKIDNVLTNTSWLYQSENNTHTTKKYDDYENNHQLQSILRICPSLKYTIGEPRATEKTDTLDLCKNNSHTNHINASLNFYTDNCILTEKTSRYIQIVKSNIEETNYKFEGGSYIGTLYGTSYVGIKVESYGIYQATTSTISGYMLVLPLDGNYTYTLTTREYNSIEKEQILSDENHVLSFQRDGDNISLYNNENSWSGTLNSSKTELNISNSTSSYTFLKK